MILRKWGIIFALLSADIAVAVMLAITSGITSRPFLGWTILNLVILGVAVLARYGSTAGRPRPKYGKACITMKGEKVKSNGEKLIADYLYQNNIRYTYEKPVRTKGLLSRHISYPDFYLEDYDTYLEYWGMVNVENERTRTEYTRSMNWKMAQYYNNRIKFISIYPSNLDNLDIIFRHRLRDVTGVDFSQ